MKKRVHTTYSDEFDEVSFEVTFEPVGDPLTKRAGDRLVVAYLAQDEDPINPMTECDGQGTLYTKPEWRGGGSITDDAGWAGYLGLTEDGESDLDLDVVAAAMIEKTAALVGEAVMSDMAERYGQPQTALAEELWKQWQDPSWSLLDWDWEVDQHVWEGLPDYVVTAEACWQELYAEGKIGAYLAVPVNYCSSNHGPGTTSVGVDGIDSCNAVWVPDGDCIANMDFTGCETYADKLKVSEKYAEGVLKEYQSWCNGDVYGCVVQTYRLDDGEWIEEGDFDSCWGFIGREYAETTLKDEFFEPAVEAAEELNAEEAAQEAEDIRTQRGLQIELEI